MKTGEEMSEKAIRDDLVEQLAISHVSNTRLDSCNESTLFASPLSTLKSIMSILWLSSTSLGGRQGSSTGQ